MRSVCCAVTVAVFAVIPVSAATARPGLAKGSPACEFSFEQCRPVVRSPDRRKRPAGPRGRRPHASVGGGASAEAQFGFEV